MKQSIAALMLCSFGSLSFAATEVSHRRYRDETARIEYSWIDNCTSKQLTVMAAKTRVKEDGVTADNGPSVSVTYSTYTFCDLNNTEQTFWFGTAADASVEIQSNLRSARVVTGSMSLQGFMFKGLQQTDLGTKNVSIDINWSSDDPIDKYAGTFVTQFPGYHEVNHLTGFYRLATATGTISDGVTNWFPTAPQGSFVQLYRLNQAESILMKD
jgi:hypothetical protein